MTQVFCTRIVKFSNTYSYFFEFIDSNIGIEYLWELILSLNFNKGCAIIHLEGL